MPKQLVLIPAFGCDERLYEPQIEVLQARWGGLVHVAKANRFAGMVTDLLAEAPPHFVVLGTSMGARLALEVALAAPQRVHGLVVIGSSPGGVADPNAGHRRTERLRNGDLEGVLADMGAMIAHLPGPRGEATRQAFITMGREVGAETMAAQSEALAHRDDKWGRVAEISCPTLCLWGREDRFSPAADGLRLARAVKNGSYVELPDCGHFPTLEYPVESTALIGAWLSSLGA